MFCGNAEGLLLPPYVCYKAQNLYSAWVRGGPSCRSSDAMCKDRCCRNGCRFNRSKSGWFDSAVFEDWFRTCFIHHVKHHPGHHVIIGDNLSSHFSEAVFELCRAHNVSFVCLPPNSTHILQPLDVAYFAPMKSAWRKILRTFKERNPQVGVIPKSSFPEMLRDLMKAMQLTSRTNLISGFRTTGIHPLNEVSQTLFSSHCTVGSTGYYN